MIYLKRTLLLVCLLTLPVICLSAQTEAKLQLLDSHFVGTWIGEYQNATKPVETKSVRVAVTEDAKKYILQMEYYYGPHGGEHYVRTMQFKPEAGTADLRWKGAKPEHFRTVGMNELLQTGYGDLTLIPTSQTGSGDEESRLVIHLQPTVFTYAWQTSTDGETFSDMAKWSFTRQPAAPEEVKPKKIGSGSER